MTAQKAWGFGLATTDRTGTVLDVWFPQPTLGDKPADATGYRWPSPTSRAH